MKYNIQEKSVYEPIPIILRPMGQRITQESENCAPRGTTQQRRIVPLRNRHSHSRPLAHRATISLFHFPSLLAAVFFTLLLASGMLDTYVLGVLTQLTTRSVTFPSANVPLVPVQKASLRSNTIFPLVPDAVFTQYTIRRGDTLSRISYNFDLSPATLISVNRLQRPEDIKVGKELIVPYRDGVRKESRLGESIQDAARRLNVHLDMVQVLPAGGLFIVEKSMPVIIPASFKEDIFRYPVPGRVISPYGQGFDDLTGIPFQSAGIDLDSEIGEPVEASRDGRIHSTGHHPSYGLYVLMDHAGAWRSFYGHLRRVDVAPGDVLTAGSLVGQAGQSGNARSPRVHFVLIHNGVTVDPLDFLW